MFNIYKICTKFIDNVILIFSNILSIISTLSFNERLTSSSFCGWYSKIAHIKVDVGEEASFSTGS